MRLNILITTLLFASSVLAESIAPTLLLEGDSSNVYHSYIFQDFDNSLGVLTGVSLNVSAKVGLHVSQAAPPGGAYFDGMAALWFSAGDEQWNSTELTKAFQDVRISQSVIFPTDLLRTLTLNLFATEYLGKFQDGDTWKLALGNNWQMGNYSFSGLGEEAVLRDLVMDIQYQFEPVPTVLSANLIHSPEPGYAILIATGVGWAVWKKRRMINAAN